MRRAIVAAGLLVALFVSAGAITVLMIWNAWAGFAVISVLLFAHFYYMQDEE